MARRTTINKKKNNKSKQVKQNNATKKNKSQKKLEQPTKKKEKKEEVSFLIVETFSDEQIQKHMDSIQLDELSDPIYKEIFRKAEKESFKVWEEVQAGFFKEKEELTKSFTELYEQKGLKIAYATYVDGADCHEIFRDLTYSTSLTDEDGNYLSDEEFINRMKARNITREEVANILRRKEIKELLEKELSLAYLTIDAYQWDGVVTIEFLKKYEKVLNGYKGIANKLAVENIFVRLARFSTSSINYDNIKSIYHIWADSKDDRMLEIFALLQMHSFSQHSMGLLPFIDKKDFSTESLSALVNTTFILGALTPVKINATKKDVKEHISIGKLPFKEAFAICLLRHSVSHNVLSPSAPIPVKQWLENFQPTDLFQSFIGKNAKTITKIKKTPEFKFLSETRLNMLAYAFLEPREQWSVLDLLNGHKRYMNDNDNPQDYFNAYSFNLDYTNSSPYGVSIKMFKYLIKLDSDTNKSFRSELNAEMTPIMNLARLWHDPAQFETWRAKWNKEVSIHDMGQIDFINTNVSPESLDVWRALIIRNNKLLAYSGKFIEIENELKKEGIVFDTKVPTSKIQTIAAKLKYSNVRYTDLAEMCGEIDLSQNRFDDYQDYFDHAKEKTAESFPQIIIKGSEVGISDNFTMMKLDHNDKRKLTFGIYTDCCQHLDGVAKECAKDSYESPYSAVYAVIHKGKIISGSWTWKDTKKTFCMFDTIEHKGSDFVKYTSLLWIELAKRLIGKLCIKEVGVGICSYGIGSHFSCFPKKEKSLFYANSSYNGYMDYSRDNGYHLLASEDEMDEENHKELKKALSAARKKIIEKGQKCE